MDLAIYKKGANKQQLKAMREWAIQGWELVGSYSDEKRLLKDAEAEKFDYLLIANSDVLAEPLEKKLEKRKIEILPFDRQPR